MSEQKEDRAGSRTSGGTQENPSVDPKHRTRTAGTDRDFDETGESANQGHGHPREERGADRP
jgi:hypothetical protein